MNAAKSSTATATTGTADASSGLARLRWPVRSLAHRRSCTSDPSTPRRRVISMRVPIGDAGSFAWRTSIGRASCAQAPPSADPGARSRPSDLNGTAKCYGPIGPGRTQYERRPSIDLSTDAASPSQCSCSRLDARSTEPRYPGTIAGNGPLAPGTALATSTRMRVDAGASAVHRFVYRATFRQDVSRRPSGDLILKRRDQMVRLFGLPSSSTTPIRESRR